MADAEAEVGKKQASAMKDEAQAEKTMSEIEGSLRKDELDVAKMTQDAERGEFQDAIAAEDAKTRRLAAQRQANG